VSDDLDPITPEAALDFYLDTRRYDLAKDTLSGHHYRINSFVRWLVSEEHGNGEVTNMNEVDLRTVHAYRVFKREENFEGEDPCNATTMQGQVSTLRVFFEHLEAINGVPEELHERIKLPNVRDGEDVDDRMLEAERAKAILDHLHRWEYASAQHVAFLLLWRTSCRVGGLRSLDVQDFDAEEGAVSFKHRPSTGTPLKNGNRGERDASLKPHVVQVIEDYLVNPNRHGVRDNHDRFPLITSKHGRPSTGTFRNWVYQLTQPCRRGEECPEGIDPDTCEYLSHEELAGCPVSLSPHPVRAGSITAHRDAGTPREVVSDRGDVSEKILERHYDQASERQRMRRRREFIPDNL